MSVPHWKWARERRQKGQPHGLPFHLSACYFRRTYCGACTRIRVAVMVKVPLMLGMGLPFRS